MEGTVSDKVFEMEILMALDISRKSDIMQHAREL